MSKELKSLKDLWKKVKESPSKGQFDEMDDGRYLCIIVDTEVNNSLTSERLQMFIEFKVQEGESEGKTKRMYIGLDSEIGIQVAINTLNRLGLDVEDPSELDEELKGLIGKIVKIRLKTKTTAKGEFQNVFVEKVVGLSDKSGSSTKESNEIKEPEVEPEEPIVEEGVELKKGMEVVFTLLKKEVTGKVISIDEATAKAVVEHKGKKYRMSCDALSVK